MTENSKSKLKLRLVKPKDDDTGNTELLEGNSDIVISVSLLGLCLKRLTQEDVRELSSAIRSILPQYVRSVSFRVEKLSISDIHQEINPRIRQ